LAFTTISGAAYGADTAFIGTSIADTISIVGLVGSAYLEGDAAGDAVNVTNFKNIVTDYTLKGGQGNDTISIDTASLTGSFIAGNSEADTIFAFGITDSTLQGGQGNDSITTFASTGSLVAGNKGADTLVVSAVQSSSVWGGQGNDSLNVSGSIIGSSIQGDLENDRIDIVATVFTSSTVSGGLGNDTIFGTGTGAAVGLVFDGNEGSDSLVGGAGNDKLNGGDDNDVLAGAAGKDTLDGGAGNDEIAGGLDADTLIGGGGSNFFTGTAADSFSGAAFTSTSSIDVISDWTRGGTTAATVTDTLKYTTGADLATGDTTYATLAAAITAMTTAGIMLAAQEYEVVAVGSGTSFTSVLFINADGGTSADGAVQLGVTGLYGSAVSALGAITAANIVA